jgi:hypothetical protein
MNTIYTIHRLFGGIILPLLTLLAAIWFTARWAPDSWPGRPARLFRLLVDIQFLLGLSVWIYLIIAGAGARYLTFPFLLHPILGLLAGTVALAAVRQGGPAARLGRWAPLATLGLLLALILGAGTVARLI